MKSPFAALKGPLDKAKALLDMAYRRLDETVVEAASPDGLVKLSGDGRGRIKSVAITRGGADDAALEASVLAACNDLHEQATKLQDSETKKATGGILPPGLALPLRAS